MNRWIFNDQAGDIWTVPLNPNQMSKVRGGRQVTAQTTTAVRGQTLYFEGNRGPGPFTFSGVLLTKAHYLDLDKWVFQKGRIMITDHYLRKLYVVLQDFDATPTRSVAHYWKHNYQVSGLIHAVDFTNAVDNP